MTAKLTASADGSKVLIGTAAEDALQIDATAKTIKALSPYTLAGNGPAFFASLSVNQPIVQGALIRVLLDAEELDSDNAFASSRFTPQVAGWYFIHGRVNATGSLMTGIIASIYKNGLAVAVSLLQATFLGTSNSIEVSSLIYFNGSTDYVELFGQINATADQAFISDVPNTSMNGFLVRAT